MDGWRKERVTKLVLASFPVYWWRSCFFFFFF